MMQDFLDDAYKALTGKRTAQDCERTKMESKSLMAEAFIAQKNGDMDAYNDLMCRAKFAKVHGYIGPWVSLKCGSIAE